MKTKDIHEATKKSPTKSLNVMKTFQNLLICLLGISPCEAPIIEGRNGGGRSTSRGGGTRLFFHRVPNILSPEVDLVGPILLT